MPNPSPPCWMTAVEQSRRFSRTEPKSGGIWAPCSAPSADATAISSQPCHSHAPVPLFPSCVWARILAHAGAQTVALMSQTCSGLSSLMASVPPSMVSLDGTQRTESYANQWCRCVRFWTHFRTAGGVSDIDLSRSVLDARVLLVHCALMAGHNAAFAHVSAMTFSPHSNATAQRATVRLLVHHALQNITAPGSRAALALAQKWRMGEAIVAFIPHLTSKEMACLYHDVVADDAYKWRMREAIVAFMPHLTSKELACLYHDVVADDAYTNDDWARQCAWNAVHSGHTDDVLRMHCAK